MTLLWEQDVIKSSKKFDNGMQHSDAVADLGVA